MYCDGFDDCKDSSDEINCTECDSIKEFLCPSSLTCISNTKRCDGTVDCVGGFDEYDCTNSSILTCKDNEFKCTKEFECIPMVIADWNPSPFIIFKNSVSGVHL